MSLLHPHEIRQQRPFRCLFWIVLIVFLAVGIQWYYHRHINAQQAKLQLQNLQLKAELANLQTKFQTISQTQSSRQQLEAIHQATTTELESRLQQLQQNVIDLNKELMFYQNITQGIGSSELQIRDLQLRVDNSDVRQLRYRLVLTQGENISEPITGQVIVKLQADADTPNNAVIIGEHGLSLRYVQVIEGSFARPEKSPAQLVVTLMHKDKTLTSSAFNWQEFMPDQP